MTFGPIGPPSYIPPTKQLDAQLKTARTQLEVTGERAGVGSEAYTQQSTYLHHLEYLRSWASLRDAATGASTSGGSGNAQRMPSGQERPGHEAGTASHGGGGGGGPRRVS